MKLKLILTSLLILCTGIGVLELLLRLAFGLGSPPLSLADPDTGYRFQPNQKLFRFGKHIEYNQFSQRNTPIAAQKPAQTRRILMVGDSVLNGGVFTDQSQIITELLRSRLAGRGGAVEVLNASAGSWGIENRIGYVREFGTFESDAIIFQIGTSDLIQPTSTGAVVGVDPNFPNRRPWSAIAEGWIRYVYPFIDHKLLHSAVLPVHAATAPTSNSAWFQRNLKSFSTEIQSLRSTAKTRRVPIIVLYTPDRSDVYPTPQAPLYKAEFMQQMQKLKIPVVDLHKAWSPLPPDVKARYFHDTIHLNEAGNQAVAELLFDQLCVQQKSSWCNPK